jgi:hypothetical protein
VLIVGHLPMPGPYSPAPLSRLAAAGGAAQAYLAHVLRETERPVPRGAGSAVRDTRTADTPTADTPTEDTRALRWTLRREAYRALAEARTAIALAAAELPALARHSEGADEIVAVLERIVDTTTACAVHLDDSGRLTPEQVHRLTELLDELGRLDGGRGRVEIRLPEVPLAG